MQGKRNHGHRAAGLRAVLAAAALLAAGASLHAAEEQPRVRVVTNMGSFVIQLEPERAPLTVENFLRYVREGFYTNTLIHRVVPGFVIQGGGHDAGDYSLKPTHPAVVNESGNGLRNVRGAVGMARESRPHTGNSQFYVNLVDNPALDPLPSRWGYAVFGRVVEGMDVVERIGVVPTGRFGPFEEDAPLKPVVIEKIELIGAAAEAPAGDASATSTE